MVTLRVILAMISAVLGMFLAIPVVMIAIPFWIVAFLTRHCSRLFMPPAKSWESIIEFDEHAGWKPKPNLDAYCSFAAGIFRVKTDSQGWRGEEDLSQCPIVVLGDSFAFGFGVNDERAFFSVGDSRLRIKAIGAPGYNMVQELIWLDKMASQIKGKLVVWFICLANDLYDNLIPNLYQYRMPFVRQFNGAGSWELVTSHLKPATWPFNPELDSRTRAKWEATFTDKFPGQRAYSACEFLIERAKGICNRAEARLVLVTVPWVHQLDEKAWWRALSAIGDPKLFNRHLPDEKIREICSKLEVPFVSGRDYLGTRDHIPREGHWNVRGHRRIATLLSALYGEHLTQASGSGALGVTPDRDQDDTQATVVSWQST